LESVAHYSDRESSMILMIILWGALGSSCV
jgi:hypothetical protein